MPVEFDIEKMTLEEKLRAMETLWADLSRNAETLQSPDWHGDVLKERAARVASGEEQYVDWEQAKRELRQRLT